MFSDKRLLLIFGITLLSIVGMFTLERIKQDTAYHLFADSRLIAQIPNLLNVLSNLPFMLIGFLGIRINLNNPAFTDNIRLSYLLFFVGVLLTGFGSCYYHLQPDNFTLLWDRLPLAISIMAIFCVVVAHCISEKIGNRLLFPLIAVAVAAVLYWYYSELLGQGDLRPYVLVQFLPIALMPLILLRYDGNRKGCAYVWGVLGVYVLAKIAEALDAEIYRLLHVISGHSIKHLLVALGTYHVYAASKKRLEKH